MGFTGTTAQYNTAKASGLIKDGMKVTITDDYQEASGGVTLVKVSGTTPSSGNTEFKVCSLPTGYTIDNCYIVSVDIEYSSTEHCMHYCDISTFMKNDGIYMNMMTRTSFLNKPVSFLLYKYE